MSYFLLIHLLYLTPVRFRFCCVIWSTYSRCYFRIRSHLWNGVEEKRGFPLKVSAWPSLKLIKSERELGKQNEFYPAIHTTAALICSLIMTRFGDLANLIAMATFISCKVISSLIFIKKKYQAQSTPLFLFPFFLHQTYTTANERRGEG